jgi:hypothetical protein
MGGEGEGRDLLFLEKKEQKDFHSFEGARWRLT